MQGCLTMVLNRLRFRELINWLKKTLEVFESRHDLDKIIQEIKEDHEVLD